MDLLGKRVMDGIRVSRKQLILLFFFKKKKSAANDERCGFSKIQSDA